MQEVLGRSSGHEPVQAHDTLQTFASALRYISKNSQVKGIAAKLAGAVKELDSSSNVSAMRNAA